jgi:mono/diheme cytochrome c family protein
LAGKRRVGRTDALSALAVTGGARHQASLCVTLMIEKQTHRGCGIAAVERQAGIVTGHRLALASVQRLGNPAHLRVMTPPVGISLELPFQIARIQSRQSRRTGSVPAPVEPVTGEASVARTRFGTAQRNQSSVLGQTIKRGGFGSSTSTQQGRGRDEKTAHPVATARSWRLFPLAAIALVACKPPPDQRHFMPMADGARGKEAIERVGCGSCHTIPGVRWPQGKVGPTLAGLPERALIAGRLPNRPDVLAAYIRNAPALVPGSGMPAMPVSETEAQDIAAYLYEQGAR